MAVILVIDDRPINREFMVDLLRYAGHETHVAGDGLEGLEIARKVRPDLVITDVLMPTMDGVEFTNLIKADPALYHIPVIFYTATYRLPEARALAVSCGAVSVIAKPSEPQEILDAVHAELGVSTELPPPEQMPVPTGKYRSLAMDQLCITTVHELSSIQQAIRDAVEEDDTPSAKARQLHQITTRLDTSLQRAQALSMRLASLIELSLDLASQQELRPMFEMFCHASQDILNARIVAVCAVTESGKLLEFVVRGMTGPEAEQVESGLEPKSDWFARMMREPGARRFNGNDSKEVSLSLPQGHPVVHNLVAAPLRADGRCYGWFYAANKLGGDFSEEDEQLAMALAAQLLPQYENALLVDGLQRNAGLLEVEADERKHALQELQESETRFRQLAEAIRETFFLVDARSDAVLYVSPAYEEIFGRSSEHLLTHPGAWLDAVHSADRFRVLRSIARGRRTGQLKFKFRIESGTGIRWIRVQSFPIRNADGGLDRIAGIAEDVTEGELQRQRIERLSRIQAVLSGINSAIVRIHKRGELLDEAVRIAVEHGRFPISWIGLVQPGNSRIDFVACRGTAPGIADAFSNAILDESIAKTGPAFAVLQSCDHLIVNDISRAPKPSRSLRLAIENGYKSVVALPLVADDKPAGVIILLSAETDFFDEREIKLLDELAGDISFALEYITREEQLRYLAYYDSLTDLPNTTLFHEHLANTIEQSSDTKIALFLIDVDRFTHINDTLGRHIGDQLLTSLAKRIKQQLSSRDHMARIGSDTFAVAIPSLRDESVAGSVLQDRIMAAFVRPFDLNGNELRVSARVGIAIWPDDGRSSDTLFKNAEAALKEAKDAGSRYCFYSSELNHRIGEDLALEQQLLGALEREEFEVYYQPKISVESRRVTGYEALLRWNNPERGIVSPASFIPVLESSELILDVGLWVLQQSLADWKRWHLQGLAPPPVAVNVSPVQLRYPDFTDSVLGMLGQYEVEGKNLELEITESLIMADIETSIGTLERLAEAGVTIAVDDFGTGYSSLRYLAKLPLHALKIDRSFIVSMTTHADSMTLVSTIISLARAFGLIVVAEGVDSDEQAKFLTLMKCDMMQGYLFGRPAPAAQVEQRLIESLSS